MAKPPDALTEVAAREDVDAVRRLLRGLDARAAFPFRRWLTLKLGRGELESCGPLAYDYWSARHSSRLPVDFRDVDFIDGGRGLALVVEGTIHSWDALSGSLWSSSSQSSSFDAIATIPYGNRGVGVGKSQVMQLFQTLSKAPYRELRRTSSDFGSSIALHPLGVLCAEGTGGSPGKPITRTERYWVDDEYEPRVYPEWPELAMPYWKEVVTVIGYETPPRDHGICVWDLQAGRMLRGLEHEGPVVAVAISADGTTVAALSKEGSLRVYELRSGTERMRLMASPASQIAVSPDGGSVFVPSADGIDLFRDGYRASMLHTGEKMKGVTLSLDGTLAAAVSHSGTMYLFELPSQRKLGTIELTRETPLRVRISPDMCQVVMLTSQKLYGVELRWAPATSDRGPVPSLGLERLTLEAMPYLVFAGHGETPLELLARQLRVPLQLAGWPAGEQALLGHARPIDFCPEFAGAKVTTYRDDWLHDVRISPAQRLGGVYLRAGGDGLMVTVSPVPEELGTAVPLLGDSVMMGTGSEVRVHRDAGGWHATASAEEKAFLDGAALGTEGRALKNGSRLIIGERAWLAWIGEPHTRRSLLQALPLVDPLTGLPSSPALVRHLSKHAPGGLLCFELEEPMQARLEYGDGADLWLNAAIAAFIGQRVMPPAFLAWLGDAFALFLPNSTPKSLQSAARTLCDRVESESFGLVGAFVRLRCGGELVPATGDPQACIKRAREKMYDALHFGNGPVVV